MKLELLQWGGQVFASAFNGLYQGILVTALVAVCLRFGGKINAATRHAIWLSTLCLVGLIMSVHCFVGVGKLERRLTDGAADSEISLSDAAQQPALETEESGNLKNSTHDPLPVPATTPPLPEEASHIATPAPANSIASRTFALEPSEIQPDGIERQVTDTVLDAGVAPPLRGDVIATIRDIWERFLNPLSLNLSLGSGFASFGVLLFLGLWLIVGGIRSFLLIRQLVQIQRLKRNSAEPSPELQALFQRMASHHHLSRTVALKVSQVNQSAFVLGFFHPVILLPAKHRLEPGETELILRHELAHVQRRDDWANLVQHLASAVLFLHPAVWWISKRLSLEREIACDDHVLQQSGRPQTYALVLLALAGRMQKQALLLAPGSSNHKTQLKERIDMILNKHRNSSPRLAKAWLAIIASSTTLLAGGLICSAPRLVMAEPAPEADAEVEVETAAEEAAEAVNVETTSPEAAPAPAPAPTPAIVSPGAKIKAPEYAAGEGGAVTIASPAPQPAIVVASPSAPAPMVVVTGLPGAPVPPRAPKAARNGDDNSGLEARLEKLERKVDSLLGEGGGKGRAFAFGWQPHGPLQQQKELAKLNEMAQHQAEMAKKQGLDAKELEKIKELAQVDVKRAAEETAKARVEFDKARKAEAEKYQARKSKSGGDVQKQLEILRKQLDTLEKEREQLDRKIEKLEEAKDRLEDTSEEEEQACLDLSQTPSVTTLVQPMVTF